jgi:glycosyltransferase involved in cell wall biosynthesis
LIRVPRGGLDDLDLAERQFGIAALPFLAGGRFDVVHSLGVRDAVASLQAAKLHPRRRTVYTCLGIPEAWFQDSIPTAFGHFRVVQEIGVYGCLSRYAQRCLQDDYGRNGALTPGGVEFNRFRPTAQRAPVPTLLYSGAIAEHRKGVPELLRAVALLAQREPNVRLLLSGPGDPAPMLREAPAAARERTEVLPLGTPNDQPDRYSSAWATVLPSHHEAFGLVLIESLACGTPIVSSDDGSLPELIQPGIGVAAPVSDPEALARACAEALELSATAGIRERCRAGAAPYDWETGVAPRLEALYEGARPDEAAARSGSGSARRGRA